MPDVSITGLKRVNKPRPNQGGSKILAYFDCEVSGFELIGCALVRTANNGLVAWPPRLEDKEGARRAVVIRDDATRHAMMINAREAYRALGGTDAEWVGKCIPMGPRSNAAGIQPIE
jgi:hypothetical protein